jgi:hypothetical protein
MAARRPTADGRAVCEKLEKSATDEKVEPLSRI